MTIGSDTFDKKRTLRPYGLKDIDKAFTDWFVKKMSFSVTDKDGNKKEVPITFVSFERWAIAREQGIRDKNNSIILPIIAITRTEESGTRDGPTSRTFADLSEPNVLWKEYDPKSSQIKNLIKERNYNIDPDLPIYQIYSFDPPVHYNLTYQVDFWSSYLTEVNEFLENFDSSLNFKSVKSFQFEMENGLFFTAIQDETVSNDSNVDDFSGQERIQRRSFIFNVSAHILPESKTKQSPYKRYWSQTKVVVKEDFGSSETENNKHSQGTWSGRPNFPLSFMPEIWLRSDKGVVHGSPVTEWQDQSGHGNHFAFRGSEGDAPGVSSLSGAAPEYISLDRNSFAAVQFSGGIVSLSTSLSANFDGGVKYTSFVVFDDYGQRASSSAGVGGNIFNVGQRTVLIPLYYECINLSGVNDFKVNVIYTHPDSVGQYLKKSGILSGVITSSIHVLHHSFDSTKGVNESTIKINNIIDSGSVTFNQDLGIPITSDIVTISLGGIPTATGPVNNFSGSIYEFMYFTSSLTDEQSNIVADYLSGVYNSKLNYWENEPYFSTTMDSLKDDHPWLYFLDVRNDNTTVDGNNRLLTWTDRKNNKVFIPNNLGPLKNQLLNNLSGVFVEKANRAMVLEGSPTFTLSGSFYMFFVFSGSTADTTDHILFTDSRDFNYKTWISTQSDQFESYYQLGKISNKDVGLFFNTPLTGQLDVLRVNVGETTSSIKFYRNGIEQSKNNATSYSDDPDTTPGAYGEFDPVIFDLIDSEVFSGSFFFWGAIKDITEAEAQNIELSLANIYKSGSYYNLPVDIPDLPNLQNVYTRYNSYHSLVRGVTHNSNEILWQLGNTISEDLHCHNIGGITTANRPVFLTNSVNITPPSGTLKPCYYLFESQDWSGKSGPLATLGASALSFSCNGTGMAGYMAFCLRNLPGSSNDQKYILNTMHSIDEGVGFSLILSGNNTIRLKTNTSGSITLFDVTASLAAGKHDVFWRHMSAASPQWEFWVDGNFIKSGSYQNSSFINSSASYGPTISSQSTTYGFVGDFEFYELALWNTYDVSQSLVKTYDNFFYLTSSA